MRSRGIALNALQVCRVGMLGMGGLRRALERVFEVFDVYEEIANGFACWRARPWPVARFGGKGVILDLGAGACVNGIHAYGLGGRYLLCLDLSYRMSLLSRKAIARGRVLGDSVAGDMLFIPLRDSSVDSLMAIASLHHVPRELVALAFKEMARVAKDGAIIIITVWSWRQPRFAIPTIINALLRALGLPKGLREYAVPWRRRKTVYRRYYNLYTLSELLDLCTVHGLKVLSYGYVGYTKRQSDNVYVIAKALKHRCQSPKQGSGLRMVLPQADTETQLGLGAIRSRLVAID